MYHLLLVFIGILICLYIAIGLVTVLLVYINLFVP